MFDNKKLTLREKYFWFRGIFRLRSHKNRDGSLKVARSTYAKACVMRDIMEKKRGRKYDVYLCLWCILLDRKIRYHIGGTVVTMPVKHIW